MDGRQQHRDHGRPVAGHRRQAARRRHLGALGRAARSRRAGPRRPAGRSSTIPPVSGLAISRTKHPERRRRSASARADGRRPRARRELVHDAHANSRAAAGRRRKRSARDHERGDDHDPHAVAQEGDERVEDARRGVVRERALVERAQVGRAARPRARRSAAASRPPGRSRRAARRGGASRARKTEPIRHSSASTGRMIAIAFSSRTPRCASHERAPTARA